MCLQDQGNDDDNIGSVGRVRRSRELSDDNRGVGRGHRIDDVSEGSETTTEAEGGRLQAQGIYNNDRGVGREG